MGRLLSGLLVLIVCAVGLPAQTRVLTVSPDSLTLTVGDTARPLVAVRAGNGAAVPGAALTFSGAHSSVITAHRDGLITARGTGCTTWRVTHATYARAQVAVCVVAATPAPAPDPAPPPVGAVWSSDWSTGTGSTAAALLDGGRWSRAGGSGFDVVSAASVGLTAVVPSYTGNVGRARIRQASWGQVQVDHVVPASTSHTITYLFRNSAARRNDHGAGHNILRFGSNEFQILADGRYGGESSWQAGVVVFSAPYPHGRVRSPALQNDVWYERETFIEYHPTNPVLYRAWPRIRRADGQDIAPGIREYDARHFSNAGEVSATTTLAQWYAASASNWSTLAQGDGPNAEAARHWGIGTEDPMDAAGYDPPTPAFIYYARVRVSLGGSRPGGD
jgi:hypothetical protein